MRIFAAPAHSAPVVPPPVPASVAFSVGPEQRLRGVPAPETKPRGTTTAMAAAAELKDSVPESERALAQQIAEAMQPPLMSRLARIKSSFDEDDELELETPALAETPPPIPDSDSGLIVAPFEADAPSTPLPLSPAMRDFIADDPDVGFSTPPSAEWLGKARRERNRARLSNALAWLATLLIVGAIVSGTMMLLAP